MTASHRDHWLRLNHASRIPRRLVCLDAEADRELTRRGEEHLFKLACASFDRLDERGRPAGDTAWCDAFTPADLWRFVDGCTSTQHRTVVFAHNLAYDIRLTEALRWLPELGWEAKRVALNDHSCWARFARGDRTLMLCDSLTWLPVTLDLIAGDLGLPHQRLPADDAPATAWLDRCRSDVTVLRAAMLRLIAWLHDDDLGDFRPTGNAQASAAFRHRFLAERSVLVTWGADTRAAERRAAWCGRAEVWQPGLHRVQVVEYDFTAAYAHVAQREHLPQRLLGPCSHKRKGFQVERLPSTMTLYELDVDTDVPVLPADLHGGIGWPVGRFRTTVWDVEAALAEREGARLTVRRAWLYEAGPVLRDWADWTLACLNGHGPGADPLLRRVVKHWSRALIGRFALRYPALSYVRDEDEPDARIATLWDADRKLALKEIQVGRQVFEADGEEEAGSSTPMLMSAVMAHSRVRLWQLMRAVGPDELLYVDTDSVIVTAAGAERVDARLRQGHFPGLRRKGEWKGADLRAPRNIDLGDERRVAGLPRRAGQLAPGQFQAEVWESLPASLRRGRPGKVFRLQRTFTIGQTDVRRRHLPGGLSEPYRLPVDA